MFIYVKKQLQTLNCTYSGKYFKFKLAQILNISISTPCSKSLFMLSKTFDIDKKLFTLCELLPIVKGLNKKLSGELYHFLIGDNNRYRTVEVSKKVIDFICKNINLRRKLILRYYLVKKHIKVK